VTLTPFVTWRWCVSIETWVGSLLYYRRNLLIYSFLHQDSMSSRINHSRYGMNSPIDCGCVPCDEWYSQHKFWQNLSCLSGSFIRISSSDHTKKLWNTNFFKALYVSGRTESLSIGRKSKLTFKFSLDQRWIKGNFIIDLDPHRKNMPPPDMNDKVIHLCTISALIEQQISSVYNEDE
jgi:hypothetical protein